MDLQSLFWLTLLIEIWTLAAAAAKAQQETSSAPIDGKAVATFAGGCFWCMEPPFDQLDGVLATTSGYTGGSKVGPTYEEVSAGGTGHFEAVQITYDPAKVSYDQLLEVFWRNVDPLDAGGQFCDRGDQYRTAIFVHGAEQRRVAERPRCLIAAGPDRGDGIIRRYVLDLGTRAQLVHLEALGELCRLVARRLQAETVGAANDEEIEQDLALRTQ